MVATIIGGIILFAGAGSAMATLVAVDDRVNGSVGYDPIYIDDNGLYPYLHDILDDGYSGQAIDFLSSAFLEITLGDANSNAENKFSLLHAEWDENTDPGDIIDDEVIDTTPTPEPATMLLFGTGLVGLAGAVSRRRKK